MMKKLSIIVTCAFLLGLMAGPAIAQVSYNLDFLEAGNPGGIGTCATVLTPCSTDEDCFGGTFACENAGLKTFNPTWTLDEGQTVEMDIWLSGGVPLLEDLVSAGAFITYDASQVSILSVMPYDTAATPTAGLWDAGFTQSFEVDEANLGEWFIALAQFSCVVPYADGDVAIARVTFQCQGVGTSDIVVSTVPVFDTIVSCAGTNYDSQTSPDTVTITQNSGASCTVPGDCDDDGNACTTADCVNETCVYNPVVCDDADLCTVDSCDPGTGNCVFVPLGCDDGVDCTDDSCDPATGNCIYTPDDEPCDDDNLCTNDECNAVDGCTNTPVDCDDSEDCTDDSCDVGTGDCLNEPNDGFCNDDIDCTDDICDPVAGCQNEDNCDPGEFCNVGADECQPPTCSITVTPASPDVDVLGTVNFNVVVDGTCAIEPSYTWEISDTGCTGEASGSALGSTVDETGLYTAGDEAGTEIVRVTDESNGDICATAEVTLETTTTTTAIPSGCTIDDDCDDGVYCNGAESCVEGTCGAGTPPCSAELCDEGTDTCIDCLEDTDCDDGVDCTDDSCVDETCVNMPNDDNCPDDSLYCNGEESCDEGEGCTSSGNPCAANETCDEDTDSCSGACTIDVLRDSLPKSNLFILYPVVFRIETTGIEPLNALTPVTIACDADGDGPLSKSVLKTGKVIIPNLGTNTTVIVQTAWIWPAWFTQTLGQESETCTVTVGDCSDTDTFELIYGLFGIGLSE